MMEELEDLLEDFISNSTENGDLTCITDQITVGMVVDTDDPLQMGRLRVFVPAYNDDPKKLLHVPWCSYVSPSAGVVSQSSYARGHIPGMESSQGAVHYGFWDIPDIGAHVLVACINGDARRRIYLGSLISHQEAHTIGTGRFKHRGGAVDGPLTSTENPIEPAYSKLGEAFNGERNSPEWKTRGADYQISAVTDVPSPEKSLYIDDDLDTVQSNEEDAWVKDSLGEPGYDWTGYKNLGAFMAARARTWMTPSGHLILMDDRPFNSRIRVRTAAGSQLLLDDTNERIYVSTSGGKSYVEMDAAGNIDVFGERRISLHAEKDLNLSAGESIRLKANNFISMYAGDNRGQTPLTEELPQGEIRIQSAADMHIMSEANLRMQVAENWYGEVGFDVDFDIGRELNFQVAADVYVEAGANIQFDTTDVQWRVGGRVDTSVLKLVEFLDEFIAHHNDLVQKYNSHTHVQGNGNDLGGGGVTSPPTPQDQNAPVINDEGWPANPAPDPDETMFAPWTNRVPQHEPWPRVVMQDSDDPVNSENAGYKNNVDWIEQYDNEGEAGREPVGKTEGDETVERGQFWRR